MRRSACLLPSCLSLPRCPIHGVLEPGANKCSCPRRKIWITGCLSALRVQPPCNRPICVMGPKRPARGTPEASGVGQPVTAPASSSQGPEIHLTSTAPKGSCQDLTGGLSSGSLWAVRTVLAPPPNPPVLTQGAQPGPPAGPHSHFPALPHSRLASSGLFQFIQIP